MAISNGRLLGLDGDEVVYRYKNYRDGGRWRTGRMHGVVARPWSLSRRMG